ncbi:MAG: NAD(+) diphosphatase, partial [Propionibacteriaceae bacterium]|nr:NAD(+) diphosphatase [Propionibacteriaceae bacterium]
SGCPAELPAAGAYQPRTDIFLARANGLPVFARVLPDDEALQAALPAQTRISWARPMIDALEEPLALVFLAAALAGWHGNSQFCPRCGAQTIPIHAGNARYCPNCRRELFPRTDPAVIVAVTDAQDRLLLGRQPVWAAKRMSVLAGFIEAGESAEQAVHREVAEEVGVSGLRDVRYFGSQPWPFPRSLMLGYQARAEQTELRLQAAEIEQARWFAREELAQQIAEGEVIMPSRHSIAHRLISAWFPGVSAAATLP